MALIDPMPFLLLFVSLMPFMIVSNLYAAEVSLTWNANRELDLAGYKIFKRLLSTDDGSGETFPTTHGHTRARLVLDQQLGNLDWRPYHFQ